MQAKRFAGRGICAGETFRQEGNLCRRNVSLGGEFVQAKRFARRGICAGETSPAVRSKETRLFSKATDGIFVSHL